MLTRMRNQSMRSDAITVGTHRYETDQDGVCVVRQSDVSTLRDACGFEVLGLVDEEDLRPRLPQTKEELFDLVLSVGVPADALRQMADLLDAQSPPVVDDDAPRTVFVAPAPTKPSGAEEPRPSMGMSKSELIAEARRREIAFGPNWTKREIFDALAR